MSKPKKNDPVINNELRELYRREINGIFAYLDDTVFADTIFTNATSALSAARVPHAGNKMDHLKDLLPQKEMSAFRDNLVIKLNAPDCTQSEAEFVRKAAHDFRKTVVDALDKDAVPAKSKKSFDSFFKFARRSRIGRVLRALAGAIPSGLVGFGLGCGITVGVAAATIALGWAIVIGLACAGVAFVIGGAIAWFVLKNKAEEENKDLHKKWGIVVNNDLMTTYTEQRAQFCQAYIAQKAADEAIGNAAIAAAKRQQNNPSLSTQVSRAAGKVFTALKGGEAEATAKPKSSGILARLRGNKPAEPVVEVKVEMPTARNSDDEGSVNQEEESAAPVIAVPKRRKPHVSELADIAELDPKKTGLSKSSLFKNPADAENVVPNLNGKSSLRRTSK